MRSAVNLRYCHGVPQGFCNDVAARLPWHWGHSESIAELK
jgi:hypothetical protein